MAMLRSAAISGVGAGLIAGVPQVLLTQAEVRLLGLPSQRADIGPRFVRRLSQHLGQSLPSKLQWWLAAAFHFGYAASWGGVYALAQEARPVQPLVGGPMLAGLIYLVAFSPWGAATQSGAEKSPERRPERESLLHWTAALSFSLTLAYTYRWLRGHPRSTPQPTGSMAH
jgi:hypothetical protein